jgi:aryl-alcohol dehydrogenase-like predicted oxidoreductase
MGYSLFSHDAEQQGQIDACKQLGAAMMAYAVLGRGLLSAQVPTSGTDASTSMRKCLV